MDCSNQERGFQVNNWKSWWLCVFFLNTNVNTPSPLCISVQTDFVGLRYWIFLYPEEFFWYVCIITSSTHNTWFCHSRCQTMASTMYNMITIWIGVLHFLFLQVMYIMNNCFFPFCLHGELKSFAKISASTQRHPPFIAFAYFLSMTSICDPMMSWLFTTVNKRLP